MYERQALLELVRDRALRFGDFTLASGKTAKYYLDGKQVTLDSTGARLVGEGMLDLLLKQGTMPKAVGGMSIGALFIGYVVEAIGPRSATLVPAGIMALVLAALLARTQLWNISALKQPDPA